MSDEGDRILGQIVRFVREIEKEDKDSTQVKSKEAFEGEWLKRWNRLIAKAEKYLANKPN